MYIKWLIKYWSFWDYWKKRRYRKQNKTVTISEKIFTIYITDKMFISLIYKRLKAQCFKMCKRNGQFTEKQIWVVLNYMKICSSSRIIRAILIKTTLKWHLHLWSWQKFLSWETHSHALLVGMQNDTTCMGRNLMIAN